MNARTDHRVSIWRNLSVTIWRGKVDEADAQMACQSLRELTARYTEGLAMLSIIEASSGVPTAEARRLFSEGLRTASAHIRRVGVVIEGDGFQAAAVRAVSNGVVLVVKPSFGFATFQTVLAAVPWVAEGLPSVGGKKATAKEILDAVLQLRASRVETLAS
jgi:hypothetical protein